jgi:hypothetical protein
MRCLACGGELHLVQVVEDEAKMARGYEQHTFESLLKIQKLA